MRTLIFTLLLHAGSAFAQWQQPITLLTEEFPPYNMTTNGKTIGTSTEIIAQLFRNTGIPVEDAAVVPWARALQLTANQPNTCAFTAARVPEREKRYTWVGPIARSEWAMFARKKDQLRPHSLEDLRPLKIGTYIGDMSITYLRERGFKVDAASSDKLNPQKLRAGRIDLWSVSHLAGTSILKEMGYEDVEPVLRFTAVDMYLICSPDMPQQIIARLNEGVRHLHQDGSMLRIYKRYGFEEAMPVRP